MLNMMWCNAKEFYEDLNGFALAGLTMMVVSAFFVLTILAWAFIGP
jgi:hypothetical protein